MRGDAKETQTGRTKISNKTLCALGALARDKSDSPKSPGSRSFGSLEGETLSSRCGYQKNLQFLAQIIRHSNIRSNNFLRHKQNYQALAHKVFTLRRPRKTVISGKRIFPLLFALLPFHEQKVIVDKLKTLLDNSDQLEKQTGENRQYADKLMQAVLREAFEAD